MQSFVGDRTNIFRSSFNSRLNNLIILMIEMAVLNKIYGVAVKFGPPEDELPGCPQMFFFQNDLW